MSDLVGYRARDEVGLPHEGNLFDCRAMLAWMLLCWAMASGANFISKKNGETIKGQLLGTVTKDGVGMFIVKTENGQQRLLVKADWVMQRQEVTHAEAPQERFTWPPVQYEGKPRDTSWLESNYVRFKDCVVLIEGRYFEVGGAHLWASAAKPVRMFGDDEFFKEGYVFSVGDCARVVGTVFQVLSEDEMLVRLDRLQVWFNKKQGKEQWRAHTAPDGQMIRVKGCSTVRLTDGATVEAGALVAVGTYRYVTALGGTNTIMDCRRLPTERQAITRTQFAEALNKGLNLVTWTRAQRQVPIPPGNRKVAQTYWQRVPVK